MVLAANELETVEDRSKTFNDCVSWVRRSRIQNQQKNLKQALEAAEKDKDEHRVRKILGDLHALNKGIKR